MMKKIVALMLSLAAVIATVSPVTAASALIKHTEYEGRGQVEIDFICDVEYKNVKIQVTDPSGNELTVSGIKKDEDEIEFHAAGLKPSTKYSYKISGVREAGTTKYKTVKGTFKTPATELYIKKVKYDRGDKELEVDFFTRVQYKNLKVTLKDSDGTAVACKVSEKGRDDLELKVPGGLRRGGTYTLTVKGVRVYKTGKYATVAKTFKVK